METMKFYTEEEILDKHIGKSEAWVKLRYGN